MSAVTENPDLAAIEARAERARAAMAESLATLRERARLSALKGALKTAALERFDTAADVVTNKFRAKPVAWIGAVGAAAGAAALMIAPARARRRDHDRISQAAHGRKSAGLGVEAVARGDQEVARGPEERTQTVARTATTERDPFKEAAAPFMRALAAGCAGFMLERYVPRLPGEEALRKTFDLGAAREQTVGAVKELVKVGVTNSKFASSGSLMLALAALAIARGGKGAAT